MKIKKTWWSTEIEFETKESKNIFKLYKGWSFEAAIKDIMNTRFECLKNNIYPDWFKSQFKKK